MSASRICIVTPRSINDSPCLEKYRRILKEPFDIIYWSKGEAEKECGAANSYRYTGIVPVEGGKLSKIRHYYQLSRFVKAIVSKNKYDKLIIYPTHMAWMLRRMLHRKYRGKYVFDIRDYAGENNALIKKLTARAVREAGLCTITSPSYTSFLPDGVKYVVSHNIQPIDSELVRKYRSRELDRDRPIVLSFIGTVRFIEQQKKLIALFGNDPRFVLKYIGRGSEALKEYCAENCYQNVELVGQFDRSELGGYYVDTDMAINAYGSDHPALIYALSNKLYSAALMGMPVLCSPGTYTEDILKKYGFGCTVDPDDPKSADGVYQFYQSLTARDLYDHCDKFIKDVLADEEQYEREITAFFDK